MESGQTQLPQKLIQFGKRKNRKRIRPRRVPTDGDSESGRTQLPQKGRKFRKRKNNEKELGLVVSQQTVIRNQAKNQRGQKRRKFRKRNKEK